MTVKELVEFLAKQPDEAVIQPSENATLYIFDDELGVLDYIEVE